MQLTNSYNKGRKLYLFQRNEEGNLFWDTKEDFYPYFYEQSNEGLFKSFDGKSLRKCLVNEPKDIKQYKSNSSYESTVSFTKRYIYDKIPEIKATNLRWQMYDIENICTSLPRPLDTGKANEKVSCITLYDNYLKEYKQWYLGDWHEETAMLEDFCQFIKENTPDLLLAFNQNGYDYPFLFYKIPNFAEKISPVGMYRYGMRVKERDAYIDFPVGISIVDWMDWIKFYSNKKLKRYSQDFLMEHYLGKGKVHKKVDFSKLSQEIKDRNMEDVVGMVALEDKLQLISHYDSIRRLSKCDFEDVTLPLRIIEGITFQVSKELNVILPDKKEGKEKDAFQGAWRNVFENGFHEDVGEYDLSGAYLNAIIDLCLDASNLRKEPNENTISIKVKDRVTGEVINNYHVEQNPNAILPKVATLLRDEKNKYKKILKNTPVDSPEYKEIQEKYNAYKVISLISWGALGNEFYRMYDGRIASIITSIPREIMKYVTTEVNNKGYKVLQVDTDGIFIKDNKENLQDFLNSKIQEWSLLNFDKESSISFDYKGRFKDIILLSDCHYFGHIETDQGVDEIEKGIESVRKDATLFIAKFQYELLNKICSKATEKECVEYINNLIQTFKEEDIFNISFPVRISKPLNEYETSTKAIQALENTPNFTKHIGDNFYYIYVKPEVYYVEEKTIDYYLEVAGKRECTLKKEKLSLKKVNELTASYVKKGIVLKEALLKCDIKTKDYVKKVKKEKNVQAFDEDNYAHIDRGRIDWNKMIERNIANKVQTIFDAMKWDMKEIINV